MTTTLRRVEPGHYRTTVDGEIYDVIGGTQGWRVEKGGAPISPELPTKRAAVVHLETHLRAPKDRSTQDFLKLARRGEIRKGSTEITVTGLGRCLFLSHTRKDDGSEWIDVLDPKGRNRVVRPDRIKTVHRARRTGVR